MKPKLSFTPHGRLSRLCVFVSLAAVDRSGLERQNAPREGGGGDMCVYIRQGMADYDVCDRGSRFRK